MPNAYPNKIQVMRGGQTETLIDLTADTAVASDVAQGKYFHLASGERVVGTATGGGGGGAVYQDQDGYIVLSDQGGGSSVTVEALSVTQNGTYTAPTGKAYSPVTVNVSGGGNNGGLELLLSETRTCSWTSTSEGYKDTLTASVDANCLPLVFVASRVEYTTASRLLCYSTLFGTNLSTGAITTSGYPALVKGSSNGPTCSLSINQYGIYPKNATIENGTLTVPIYMKYNSSSTGTISGDYTISVYGLRFDTGVTP